MERRDTEDFQRTYMANLTLQNLQLSSSNHRRIPVNDSQVNHRRIPISDSQGFYQNNALQNYDLFQNPSSSQEYPMTQTLAQVSRSARRFHEGLEDPSSSQGYPMTQTLAQPFYEGLEDPPMTQTLAQPFYEGLEDPSSSQGYPMTQTLAQVSRPARPFYEGLEDSFSRMNLNVFSNYHNHSSLIRSSLPLQRMRVESAVRGKMGLYQEGFGGHSNSSRSIGSQNMVGGTMTRSANFPSTPMANDFDFPLQRRGPSFEGLDYPSSRRLINNSDLHCCYGNALALNGLESGNFSSNSMSSMYNHQHSKYSCLGVFLDREEIEMMFLRVKDRLHDLMVHQFHNYIIQKLLEAGNREQRTELLLLLVSNKQRFLVVCTDVHGTRGVQKFLELISSQEEEAILLSALEPVAFTLATNIHGRHIIERCLNKFSNEDTKHIVHEIADHCFDAATNQSGCRVLQQCLAQANAETRKSMFSKIIENAVILSEHPFGNYVVQYVLGMKIPHVTSEIMVQLERSFVTLSMNKHGSHVVEKCLTDAGEEHSAMIITEMMQNKKDFLTIAQNPFGNFVVLRALDVSKGDLHKALVILIQSFLLSLESHIYGKNVVRQIKGGKKRV